MPRTWLLCGIPRSGNALCCQLTDELPDTVALSQPINARYAFGGVPFGHIPRDPRSACARIGEFAEKVRAQILAERRAPSHQVEGGLYDNIMASERDAETGLRERRGKWGVVAIDKPLSARFTLLISQPAMFSALLPQANASFPCLALVRNPLSVLASWQTVNLPFQQGRLAGAEPYDPELKSTLDEEPELLRRQLIILDWFFARYCAHLDPRCVIRYEDLIESGASVLFRLLGHECAEPSVLKSRNDNALYNGAPIDALLNALLETGGAWTRFYQPVELEQAADRIRRHR